MRTGSRLLAFESLPVMDWHDPQLRFIDLTGDGFAGPADQRRRRLLSWHQSLSTQRLRPGAARPAGAGRGKGPEAHLRRWHRVDLSRRHVSGDGLTDLVRIRNGEVCYWPNLGYGRFGAKVTMDRRPALRRRDLFDGRRIRLADIDGSGTADIIYFGSAPCSCTSTSRETAGAPPASWITSRPSTARRRADRPRPARQRHGLPRLVVAAAGKRGAADALHRPHGRLRSRTCS